MGGQMSVFQKLDYMHTEFNCAQETLDQAQLATECPYTASLQRAIVSPKYPQKSHSPNILCVQTQRRATRLPTPCYHFKLYGVAIRRRPTLGSGRET
jgi:hypothetical protein